MLGIAVSTSVSCSYLFSNKAHHCLQSVCETVVFPFLFKGQCLQVFSDCFCINVTVYSYHSVYQKKKQDKTTVDMVVYIMYLKADKCVPFSCESVSALSGRQRNIFIVYSEVKKSRWTSMSCFWSHQAFGESKLQGPIEL